MRDWCSKCQFETYRGSQEPCYNCVTVDNKKPSEFIPATDEVRGVGKWNPASKPPKENGRYYVAYEDSVSFLDYFNGKWFFPPRNGIVVEETKESILYWQPFPAPPKEDANGD